MDVYEDKDKEIYIKASKISIGEDASFGKGIDIILKGEFSIGERSRLGNDVNIRGNNVSFGNDLFHSQGLRIGGGGRQHPNANFTLGDRCTIHNNFINVCEPVIIGNDVGLSPETSIITHGYWLSVLDGFPATFAGVKIDDGVIIGYRSIVLLGVHIGKNAVIGANSVITRDLEGNGIYGGNPAKLIRKIESPSEEKKKQMVNEIISEYRKIAAYHNIDPHISVDYPYIQVNECRFDVLNLTFTGVEDEQTDDFRDYVRKWGLRFFGKRPFRSVWEW